MSITAVIRHGFETLTSQLNDLQAGLETGSQLLDKMRSETGDAQLQRYLAEVAVLGDLRRQLDELLSSVAQQRVTLAEMRLEVRRLRETVTSARVWG